MDDTHAPSADLEYDTGPGFEVTVDHHNPALDGPALFQTENLSAVPVVQRSAESHNVRAACVRGTHQDRGPPQRPPGHHALSCPATTVAGTPLGFQVSDQRAYLDVGTGFQVNPGDSLRVESEAEVWIAPLPGNTSGYCQYVETFDAPSGPQPG